MTLAAPYLLWLPLTLLLLTWIARPRSNPFAALLLAAQTVIATPRGRLVFGAAAAVLAINCLECQVDPALSAWLGYDLTPLVYALEGETVTRLQALLPRSDPARFDRLVGALSVFYLAGYIAILITPVIVWNATGQQRTAGAYVFAFLLNYALVLPLYLFVPVSEVAWSGLSQAEPLIERTWPGISAAMRVGSALDNCFPSLHVSCTTTAAVCAFAPGPRGLRWSTAIGALLTAATVMALGIHWLSDVVSGIAFGWLCARLGAVLERRWVRRPGSQPAA